LAGERNVSLAILFDNEEIGSETAHGAGSPMVQEVIKRVTGDAALYEVKKNKKNLLIFCSWLLEDRF
jgi:aspartyl aminopeptidase